MNGLFAAGLILLGLAAIAGRFQRSWPYLLGAAGSACLAVLGGFALAGRDVRLDVAGWLGDPVPGQQAAALGADRLSGLFLALSFGAAVPVSIAFAVLIRGDGWVGRSAVLVVSAACLATAAVTPLEIRVIAAGLSPAVPASLTMGTLKSPWVLQPVFDGFSILSPSWLWVEMPLMLLLTVLFAWAVSGRRLLRVRRVPAWRSATIGVEGADSYTAFGYANPTRRVLAGVLHTRAELREVMMEDNGRDDGSGPPDRADPGWEEPAAHLRYASDVIEVVETYVYRPALGIFMAVVTAAKRLQSGRLDAYLLYMLIALIAVIAVVTALA